MRLKRVKVFGFKTFADRTEFDLHGNMIAVVGPNGCGKSNLVDAILWGLGEGNARHLRAQSSQDVIFSGSSRRKPVGYSEVNLLFDNEDGSLPVESSEVSITRRLNRAGESEYMINRQSCRLRDVFDLLADSGLGRAGYSIVGQKEIDQALAASPEDRRAWVDEAAGVQRYRVRKTESLKRLSSAQDHLSRVHDILSELDDQREPLRAEAEVAIRYKSILASLREVESGLLVVEVANSTKDVQQLEQRIADSMRLAKVENDAAAAAEEEARLFGERLRSIERDLDSEREIRQSGLTASERAEAAIRLGEQKLSTLNDLEANLGEEATLSQGRIAEAEAELGGTAAELEIEREALVSLREECAGAGDEAKALREDLRGADAELAKAREAHNRQLKQEAEKSQVDARIKAVRREIQGIESSLPDLTAAVVDAQVAHQDVQNRVHEFDKRIADCSEELAQLEKKGAEHAEGIRKNLSERAVLIGRKLGIESTIESHEGLAHGPKAVLDACAKGVLSGRYLPVGEALEVKKEHALAIETALGAAVNDLIVEHEAEAKTAIGYLKENRLGRATFQPLPLMRTFPVGADLNKVASGQGAIARASELIECEGKFRPVFESLLGRVVIVDVLDTALRLAKTNGWNRLVTLDGEVVHSSGAVSGGVSSKASYGLVQRKADLAHVNAQIKKLDTAILTQEQEAERLGQARSTGLQALQDLRKERQDHQKEINEAADWLHRVQSELNATERSGQKLGHELEALGSQIFQEAPDADLTGCEERRDALVAALASRSADAEAAAERLREAQSRVRQAEMRLETAQKRVTAAQEHERLRERKASNLGPEKLRASAEVSQAKSSLEAARRNLEAAEARLQLLRANRAELQQDIEIANESARKARSSAQVSTDAAHQAELSRARLETKRAASAQRLIEEYGVSEEEALLQAPNVELPSDAGTVVGRLRRELRGMGDVNIGAVEAFERLSERWDELTAQSADIEGGIREVEASIRELDKLTRERFLRTFDSLRRSFSEIFARLFPGGEGQIFLADEANILETGVEIDVLLPGKKKQRLELLSGGERSLCASAFLFALLQVKPSPLVILDEVDAPLDGRNVERFIELVQDFSASTQFILITHNPTTIAAAPVWLGVTMQEPGVSTLVPAQFAPPPVEAVVQAEPALV